MHFKNLYVHAKINWAFLILHEDGLTCLGCSCMGDKMVGFKVQVSRLELLPS